MALNNSTPFPTTLTYKGLTFCTSDKNLADLISKRYPNGPTGSDNFDKNSLGGAITDPDEFLEYMKLSFEDDKFAWQQCEPSIVTASTPAPVQAVATIAVSSDFHKLFMGFEMSKKLSLLLHRYAFAINSRLATGQMAGFVGNAMGTESLKVSKILRANADVRLATLTPEEKSMVEKEELVKLISAFKTTHENVLLFSAPEFLYYALDYTDFDCYNIEGGGYMVFLDEEYCLFDNNYGILAKSLLFDARLFQHKLKIDYWLPEFAREFMVYSRFVDMGKVSNNIMNVTVNFSLPPSDYPGIAGNYDSLSALAGEVMAMFRLAVKAPSDDVHVGTHPEWYSPARQTLGLTTLLRRCNPARRKLLATQLVAFGIELTLPLSNACSMKAVADNIEGAIREFYKEFEKPDGTMKKRWATVSEFIEGMGVEKTIGHISKAIGGITTLSDSYAGVPMPSVGQWDRWVEIGRNMRNRLPSGNIGKEYAPKRGYSSEPKGASTGRKNEKSLVTFMEFFPDSVYECESFHYVGITTNDHMLANNWQFWLNAKGNRETATKSFHGFDQNELGSNVLKGDDKFELKQGVNFTAIPFQKLVDQEYSNYRHFLYNDAFVVHSKDGRGYNPANPFFEKGVPSGFPPLKNEEDYPSPTDAEVGLYNYFAWCVHKYRCGVVKFHLDKTVTHKFWRIVGKRFLTQSKEFMLWKCGRPHNLEFHFFFDVAVELASDLGKTTEQPEEKKTDTSGDVDPKAAAAALLKHYVAPKVSAEKKGPIDRWALKREKALYYHVATAVLAELHRHYHYLNPLIEKAKIDVLKEKKAGKTMLEIVGSVPSGFFDPSYNFFPETKKIPYGTTELIGILAYGSGTKRLVKGVSNVTENEDAAIIEARTVMEAAFKKSYVEADPEDGKAATPIVKSERPKLTKKEKKKAYWERIRKHRSGEETPPK